MSDIADSTTRIQQESVEFEKPMSEQTMTLMGGAINYNLNKNDTQDTTLSDHESRITTNEGLISTNTGNISTNSGLISTNTGNISTNTSNISTIESVIDTEYYTSTLSSGNFSTGKIQFSGTMTKNLKAYTWKIYTDFSATPAQAYIKPLTAISLRVERDSGAAVVARHIIGSNSTGSYAWVTLSSQFEYGWEYTSLGSTLEFYLELFSLTTYVITSDSSSYIQNNWNLRVLEMLSPY